MSEIRGSIKVFELVSSPVRLFKAAAATAEGNVCVPGVVGVAVRVSSMWSELERETSATETGDPSCGTSLIT